MNCQICDVKQPSKICRTCSRIFSRYCHECKESHLQCDDPHNPSRAKRAIKQCRFKYKCHMEKLNLGIEAVRLKILPTFVYPFPRTVALPIKHTAIDVTIPRTEGVVQTTQHWYYRQEYETRILPYLASITTKYSHAMVAKIRGLIEPQLHRKQMLPHLTWYVNGIPFYHENVSTLPSDMDRRIARLSKLGTAWFIYSSKKVRIYTNMITQFLDSRSISMLANTSKEINAALWPKYIDDPLV